MQLADAKGLAAIMTISVYTSDYSFVGDRLIWPKVTGNQFRIIGVGTSNPPPPSPETAVTTIASATGARVAEPPAFVWLGQPWMKVMGAWRLVLDREVTVSREDGSLTRTREFYLDNRGTLRTPASNRRDPYKLPETGQILADPRSDPGFDLSHALESVRLNGGQN
jgi:hypothetical protein